MKSRLPPSAWKTASRLLPSLAGGAEEGASGVLAEVCLSFEAQAGLVLSLDGERLRPAAAQGLSLARLREVELPAGAGFAGWVLKNEKPLRVSGPGADAELLMGIGKSTGFSARSVAAAPIVFRKRKLGVLAVFNAAKTNRFPLEGLCFAAELLGAAWERQGAGESGEAFERSILDSLPAGILAVDLDGRLLSANLRAEQILRKPLKGNEKTPVKELVRDREGFHEALAAVMRAGKPLTRQSVVINLEGDPRTMGYSGAPILGPAGAPVGYTLLFQDISAFVSV